MELIRGADHSPSEVCDKPAALHGHPDEFSCCLSLRKDTSREALGVGGFPALDVIFGCPVSGAGLEQFGSDSGLIQSVSSWDCLEKFPILCLAFRVLALL